jgi:hypothetical protein
MTDLDDMAAELEAVIEEWVPPDGTDEDRQRARAEGRGLGLYGQVLRRADPGGESDP